MTETLEKNQENSVNIIDVIGHIWKGRKTLLISVLLFFVFGIIYVISTPREYKSESTVLIETSSSGGILSGILQQFSGLAGVNIDNKTKEALIPELYPEVISSTPFLMQLMDQKIIESKYDSSVTVRDYIDRYISRNYMKEYTLGLPGKIKNIFKGSGDKNADKKLMIVTDSGSTPVLLTRDELDVIEALQDRISFDYNFKKNNKISVTVEMQDPIVAAQINYLIVKKLEEYVIEYRTQKAKVDLVFITARHEDAREEYITAQENLASFRDRNKNVILESVLAEEGRLEAEYNLAFDLYNTISQQLEQAKIKVQENTPIIIVMDPANIPLEKASPKTTLVLITFILLGGLAGVFIILGKPAYKKIMKEIVAKSKES
jgi:uncharacterized protein involved in exopolysaccharide biosynthesis